MEKLQYQWELGGQGIDTNSNIHKPSMFHVPCPCPMSMSMFFNHVHVHSANQPYKKGVDAMSSTVSVHE